MALTCVKSGTTAAFYNISLVACFVLDVVYFKRAVFWTDISGTLMIMTFTISQAIMSNMEYKKEEAEWQANEGEYGTE